MIITPVEEESCNYISYVVFTTETGVYEIPEFSIEMDDPDNKSYLEPYIKNKKLTVQLRETHEFDFMLPEEALAIGRKYEDCLFRFMDDDDTVTYLTSDEFCELIEWSEENPDDSISDGSYSFFMDKPLPIEEQNRILMKFGFSREELGI